MNFRTILERAKRGGKIAEMPCTDVIFKYYYPTYRHVNEATEFILTGFRPDCEYTIGISRGKNDTDAFPIKRVEIKVKPAREGAMTKTKKTWPRRI